MSLSEDAREVQIDEDLRAANGRLLRQLDKAKTKQEDMVAAVYRAAKDAASTLVVPPVPAPKKDKRAASPEIAICLLADWQAGKVTPG